VTTDLFCRIDWDIRGLDKLNPKRVVPGAVQSPVLGGYFGTPENIAQTNSHAQIFSEKGADLGAVSGAGLVGTGFSIHEALFQRISGQTSPPEGQRSGEYKKGLCQIQAHPGGHHEFCGRHPVHPGKSPNILLFPICSLPKPAASPLF
jgi:hypothetical protein